MRPASRTSSAARLAAWATLAVLAATATGCGDSEVDSGDTAADPAGSVAAEPSTGSPGVSPSGTSSASPSEPPPAAPSLPSVTDATEAIPLAECSTVWVVGQKLPRNYQGCTEGGTQVAANGRYCEFGKPIFTYRQRFYAVENGPVNRTGTVLAKDAQYQRAVRSCGG